MIKKLVRKLVAMSGLELRRLPARGNRGLPSMGGGLARAKWRGHNPVTIVDVGAAAGSWTLEAMNQWPDSEYLLLEPLEERRKRLMDLAARHSNLHYVHAAAGQKPGEMTLFVTADLDGSGVADNGTGAPARNVPVTTIDAEVSRFALKPPYLIKLDTHGFEVPILDGAVGTLASTELLVIEGYGFNIAPGSLLFWELCRDLDARGFRVADLVDVKLRKPDLVFWQCDLVFARKDHPCFARSSYAKPRR